MKPTTLPQHFYTHVDKHGRIVIPAELREQLGLQPGAEVSLTVRDDRLTIENVKRAIHRMRGIGLKIKPELAGLSIVDEFIADRREEAKREMD